MVRVGRFLKETCYNPPMSRSNRLRFLRRVRGFVLPALAAAVLVCGCVQWDSDHAIKTDAEKRAAIDNLFERYQRSFPDVESVTPSEFRTLEAEGDTVLVDVRSPKERAVAVIPGSVSKEEFEAHAEEYSGKKIVAYCTIGYRSGQYAASLREKGFDAYNLKGSILAWVHDGGKVVDPEGNETHTIHVYGREWNLVPHAYKGVW